MVRDRLVFDAACGGPGSWTTKLKQQETDFTEQRGDGWAASVSVVLSLLKVDTQTGAQELMHDEVDQAEREPRTLQPPRRRRSKPRSHADGSDSARGLPLRWVVRYWAPLRRRRGRRRPATQSRRLRNGMAVAVAEDEDADDNVLNKIVNTCTSTCHLAYRHSVTTNSGSGAASRRASGRRSRPQEPASAARAACWSPCRRHRPRSSPLSFRPS